MGKVAKRGAALDQITAMVNPEGAELTLSMAIWSPSVPTGRLQVGNQPDDGA